MQPVIYVNRMCELNTGFVKKKMVGEGLSIQTLIKRKLQSKKEKVEACDYSAHEAAVRTSLMKGLHDFVAMLNIAYDWHLPIILSPDDIWLLITQGLAAHIDQNAEKLRHRFVEHEGKKLIEIRRDDFERGSPDNDWPGVFKAFREQICRYIGQENLELIEADFSTTGAVERAASSITLMDAMQNYFAYRVTTLCGFPKITIDGKKSDWELIRSRVQKFTDLGLDEWLEYLVPVLDEFVNVFDDGAPNTSFWQDLYKEGGGSGGPYISGWVNTLFPYIGEGKRRRLNPYVSGTEGGMMKGTTTSSFPSGMSRAPFIWSYYGQKLRYAFIAGFIGMHIYEDSTVRPLIGWGVVDCTRT